MRPTRTLHSPNLSTSPNPNPPPKAQSLHPPHLPLPRYTPFCRLQLPRAILLRLLPSPATTERLMPTFPKPPPPFPHRTSSLAHRSHNGRTPPRAVLQLLQACTFLNSLLWRRCLTETFPILQTISDYAIFRHITSPVSNDHAFAFILLICKSVPTLWSTIDELAQSAFIYVYNGNLWHLPLRITNMFLPETLQGSPTTCKECIHLHYPRQSRPHDPVNNPDDNRSSPQEQ